MKPITGSKRGAVAALMCVVALAAAALISCGGGKRTGSATPRAQAGGGVAAPSRIDCFSGVSGYRFAGHLSLQGGSGPNSSIGSLANLLRNVDFQGDFHAPDDSAITLTFAGTDGSQNLELSRVGGQLYQRAAAGAWEKSTGQGPIVSTVARLDPQALCRDSLANATLSALKPETATIAGKPVLHYTLSAAQLAATAGPFGARGTATAEAGAAIEVWLDPLTAFPVQMQLNARPGESGGGSLNVMIQVTDINGADTAIAVPTP